MVSVRGGGHNAAGLAVCDGGIVIDLSSMRGVLVDPDERCARVEGGATWGDFDHEAQAYGLATTGGETEFDKAVAEQITDPIIQLLRNALAHGIERAELRRDRGKPEDGQITIAARHEGSVARDSMHDRRHSAPSALITLGNRDG